MCNLNILIKRKYRDVAPFLMAASSHSFVNNSYGEGIYTSFDNKVIKSSKKIDFTKLSKSINHSNFIITHQRLATSGFQEKYNHPFENEDFVIVHNGVINDFLKTKGSDSWGFFVDFIKNFKEDLSHLREDRIISVLKSMFNNVNGWYSIFIYDKKDKVGYYFKDSRTQITFVRYKGCLYITTASSNLEFLSLLDDNQNSYHKKYYDNVNELDIKDNILYKIYFGKDHIKVKTRGHIGREEVKYNYNNTNETQSTIQNYFDDDYISSFNSMENIKNDNIKNVNINENDYTDEEDVKFCVKCELPIISNDEFKVNNELYHEECWKYNN